MVDACIFLEETMRGLLPIAGYGVSLIVAGAYGRFGTDEQKREMLGGIAAGRVEAIAMSEPEAGSDVGNLSCRADRPDGERGEFVLNGQKTWISAAHLADHILVIARSDPSGSKHDGLSMISVPTDAEGIEIRGIETMGGREVNDVFLTDCHVPAERVLGEVDGGWTQLDGGTQRRAPDPRRERARDRPPRLRRPLAYIKERGSSGARSAPFRRSSTGSPTSRPSSSAPGCSSTTSLAGSTRPRSRCFRGRPRWRS